MGRPRTHNADLPKYVHRKGSAYYFRDPASKRWIHLGTDLEAAKAMLVAASSPPEPPPQLDTSALRLDGANTAAARLLVRTLHASGKSNAAKRGIAWELAPQDLVDLFAQCQWRCSVSGIPFAPGGRSAKRGISPWMPSLDRIDSLGTYTRGNVRLVCSAVNFAMGDFGEEVLVRIAEAIIEKRSISSVSAEIGPIKAA